MKTRLLTIILTIVLSGSAFGQWDILRKYYKFTEGLIPQKSGVDRDTVTGWRCINAGCDSMYIYVLVSGVEDSVKIGGGSSTNITLNDNEVAYGTGSDQVDGDEKFLYDVDNNTLDILSDAEAQLELDFQITKPSLRITTVNGYEYGLVTFMASDEWYIEDDQSGNRIIDIKHGSSTEMEIEIDTLKMQIKATDDMKFQLDDNSVYLKHLVVPDSNDIMNAVSKWYRVDSINTTQASTWVSVKWDTNIVEESTYGIEILSDSTGFVFTTYGIFRVAGCGHASYASGLGTIEVGIRGTTDGTENRCLQSNWVSQTGDQFIIPFGGTVRVVPGTVFRIQYYVDNVNMDFEGPNIFDSPIAFSVNFEKISK